MPISTELSEAFSSGRSKPVAVIDIGSTAIRMVVLEVGPDGNYRRLDRANRPTRLGQDVFTNRSIERETVVQAIDVLSGYVELMKGWGIMSEDIFAIATSAIREARNRDPFIDRVFRKTGLKIRVVEGVEENYLTFIAVQHAVDQIQNSFSRANSLILEVGGGSIELMVLKRGKMAATHSLKMGTIRMEQQLRPSGSVSGYPLEEYVREQFRVTMEGIETETSLGRIKYYIMVGGDARTIAKQIGKAEGDALWYLKRNNYLELVDRLQSMSEEDLVKKLNISYHEAESLLPALLVHKVFLEETDAETLIVPNVSIREGVFLRYALGRDKQLADHFRSQVIASATSLGRKFHFDERHGEFVAKLSINLFDRLESEHGLGTRERLFLYLGALLHDIGYFVNASGHHKHGQYIVQNSEIFGLSKNDIRIVSNLVRYHRGSKLTSSHLEFNLLTRDERLMAMKLASILRIADALDRSHAQHIQQLDTEVREDAFVLKVQHAGDLSIERFGLEQKADLFEEVFGYRVVLEQTMIGAHQWQRT